MTLPLRRIVVGLLLVAMLALLGAFTLPLGGASARSAANEWAGTWDTDWGKMVLKQSGNTVTGTYTHDQGQIAGTASGLVLTGTWTEVPTRAGPTDAGAFQWTMKPDLRTFSGTWTYEGGGGGNWVATRVGAPPSTKPKVKALTFAGYALPGAPVSLRYTVQDGSGKAMVYVHLYQDGTEVWDARGQREATGEEQSSQIKALSARLTGPLRFCVGAVASGQKSAGFPKSSCAWVPLLVDIARVSNGCGGSGWEKVVKFQNWIGNTSEFLNSNTDIDEEIYKVDFVAACNLHDAGYKGVMVRDTFNGDRPVDFRREVQSVIDEIFRDNMRKSCDAQIQNAATARKNCKATGGWVSIGAESRYNLVRRFGHLFYDSDLTRPGVQRKGLRYMGN
jgi:hypothetical protein